MAKLNFCGQIFRIVQISVFFFPTCHFLSAMPTSCPVFRYYSSSIAILRICALRVTLTSTPASRSIRFAASAAKFSISRCLSCPEKQLYQINRVFHIFSILVNFERFWWSELNSSSCFHAGR